MSENMQTLDNYLAKLNFEGDMDVWENNRIKLDYVFKKINSYLKPGMSTCDIGIGEGYTLMKMYSKGMNVTGIDIAKFSIEYLKEQFIQKDFDINLIYGDIAKIDIDKNQFDIVTCFDVLEHTSPDGLKPSIESIKKCLKNNGLLIGTLPLREDLDESKVACPKCAHEFHRYGHFHSFESISAIADRLGSDFQLIKFGEVPYTWFKSNLLNKAATFTLQFIKKIANRKFGTTVYFVARLHKA